MLKTEYIYKYLPVCLQNIAISFRGWSFNRNRYGRAYYLYVNELMRSQWFSSEQFFHIQQNELRSLLKIALKAVPYYRNILNQYKNVIDKFDIRHLKDLPFLEKSVLRTNTSEIINRKRSKYGYEEGHTSGTSGIPLVWPYDLDSMQYNLAFRERQYRWAGITGREVSARFSGRMILGGRNKSPYWRFNYPEKQWLFSSYHLTDEILPLYYDALIKINPAYLDGYPGTIFSIAKWINQQNKSGLWRPWAVITTAETLMDFQREEIEKAFGCKVFNFYSSSEGAPFVTQCPVGSLHLNPESGIIEFLRPDGTDAEPGEDAELVVTSFFQRSMPLIRYRIGDTGALAENQICPCGIQMPIVKYIGGREADVLYSSERGRISSAGLSTALYKIPFRLKESQIEQMDTDKFVFRHITNGNSLHKDEKRIILGELHSRLGDSVEILLSEVDSIPKGPGGKSRLIIGRKSD